MPGLEKNGEGTLGTSKKEAKQSLVEYAVILLIVIAVAAIAVANRETISNTVNTLYTNVVTQIQARLAQA